MRTILSEKLFSQTLFSVSVFGLSDLQYWFSIYPVLYMNNKGATTKLARNACGVRLFRHDSTVFTRIYATNLNTDKIGNSVRQPLGQRPRTVAGFIFTICNAISSTLYNLYLVLVRPLNLGIHLGGDMRVIHTMFTTRKPPR